MAYALSGEMKIIDLGWPWMSLTTSVVGYFSDSWVSCIHTYAACTFIISVITSTYVHVCIDVQYFQ